MKIAIITPNMLPHIGGIETVVHELANRCDVSSTIYGPKYNNNLIDNFKKKYNIHYLKILCNISGTPVCFSLLYQLLKSNADIFHVHYPHPIGILFGWIASKLKKKPLIVTYHSDIIKCTIFRRIVISIFERVFLMRILKDAKIVTVSTMVYPKISSILSKITRKYTFIPWGVSSLKDGKDVKQLNVLFFGRLCYYKGVDTLLEAFRQVKMSIPCAILTLAGDGSLLHKLKEKSYSTDIIFTGKISEKKKKELLKTCTCLVLPSIYRSEAFGIVLIEAMAYGKPVITTDIGGPTWIVNYGKSGIVVPIRDVDKLAKAIIKVLFDKKFARKLGNEAKKRVKQHFLWKNIIKKMNNVYYEAMLTYN